MGTLFPLNLPSPTVWYVVLYVVTLLMHVAFMSYVLAGSIMLGVAGARGMLGKSASESAWSALTTILKDWMPFALSAAITAGIAPLLFVQILYQQEFYTANLLSFHRWMAILPVLIVAFYLLYLLKAHRIEGKTALQGGVALLVMAAVLFVAWSWIENHLLSLDRGAWVKQYESQSMVYASSAILPRLGFWIASGFATASVLLMWQLEVGASGVSADVAERTRRPLAYVGAIAMIVAMVAGVPSLGLMATGSAALVPGVAHLVGIAAIGAATTLAGLFLIAMRKVWARSGVAAASIGLTAFWTGVLFAREAVRIQRIGLETVAARHESVGTLAGFIVFLVFAVIGVGTIVWIVRSVRNAQRVAVL